MILFVQKAPFSFYADDTCNAISYSCYHTDTIVNIIETDKI